MSTWRLIGGMRWIWSGRGNWCRRWSSRCRGGSGRRRRSNIVRRHCDWLARLLRLEGGSLSDEEVSEALRLHLRYSPDDLFIPDWAAAFLLDRDCEETLQTIEFTNLQLLEFRNIDNRLDDSVKGAY